MTPLWQVVAVLAEIVRWLSGPPVSLADAAWREAIRREVVGPPVAAYTNATLPAEAESIEPAPDTSAPPSPPTAGETDEAAWRRRVRQLADAIEQNLSIIAETEARLALLETQAVSRDDPAQQAALRQQARQARESLTGLRRKVTAGQQALSNLLEDARRLGVPPGWLR